MINRFFLVILIVLNLGCDSSMNNAKLPILGRQKIVEKSINGEIVYDTLDHRVQPFAFYNQDSVLVTNTNFKGKVYIADFFFTSCPTICPAMKKQMLRVYKQYESNDNVQILSHTIDPTYDDVDVLKRFSEALGVEAPKWHFVTGKQEDIYQIAESSYMVTAGADQSAPGGYIHSGAFMLVDGQGRIRGVYDGTLSDQVDILINDIRRLIKDIGNEK